MGKRWRDLWTFLNTDIVELDLLSSDNRQQAIAGAKSVLQLTETFSENADGLAFLAPIVDRVESLLQVLESPLTEAVVEGLPIVSIGVGILQAYQEKTRKPLTLIECVSVVVQGAYLDSLAAIASLLEDESLQQKVRKLTVNIKSEVH